MLTTNLGHALLIVFATGWILRMIEQVAFFGIKDRISLALTLIFLAGSAIYLLPVILR
jgi:hypothetical protein